MATEKDVEQNGLTEAIPVTSKVQLNKSTIEDEST